MADEPALLDELRRLRARVPQLNGALVASVDGLVLAQDTPGVEPEGLAALTAAALGVAVRITDATGQGSLREVLLRGQYGYVATYAAGDQAVLTLLAQDRVNVGRLHLEGRRAGARVGELVHSALPAPPAPPARPARSRAATRTATTTPPTSPQTSPQTSPTPTTTTTTTTATEPRTTTES
ncbi:roadblock/LC7 domain-containing protein [Streptomyces sp. NPDC018693]|uniref:roadblock/LC7 domain-containing protein n=1 Tax=unclassified Streptomyces TaxID=2593676 RepID=UPI0037B1D6D1